MTFLDIKQFKGNLFHLLELPESYIKEHIDWRAELKDRERKEIPEIPIRAIVEALVNSLCHRDYKNPKGNEIAIFKDRVEIYNPGQFPEEYTPEDFIKGKERSILRNPLIANILYLSRDIERWGSGIRRIYTLCKKENVKVKFVKLKSGFLVVFYRKVGGYPENVPENVPENAPESRLKIILEAMLKNNKITITDIANLLKVNEKTIKRDIEKLKARGSLKRLGPDKGGYWKVLGAKDESS